jgi:phage-related protein
MKPVHWIGSSLEDLRAFPVEVKRDIGFALDQAQRGGKHATAKPLHGFGDASVLEIVENHDGDTYRAVYTVRFAEAIYVLHCFQKKSKRGIKTTQRDLSLIAARFKKAREDYQQWRKAKQP